MIKGKIRQGAAAGIAAMLVIMAAGCGESAPITSEAEVVEGYTDAQIMLVAVTERNRYNKIYTGQIWGIQVDREGTTFQEHLLGEVRHFLEEVKTMNRMADQEAITLTNQEQERLRELTEDYYGSLTETDRSYIGVSQEEVYQLYSDYYRAEKLVNELTKDVDLEISDSEAKVIRVQEIQIRSHEEAQRIHTQAMTEGVDFSSLARAVSEAEEIERSVGRGERSKEYEEAAFMLTEGEISPIIRDGDWFFIVKCLDEYDEEATLDRKEKLALNRKNQVFRSIYEPFAAENQVDLDEDVWDKIPFLEDGTATSDFFEWYTDYME